MDAAEVKKKVDRLAELERQMAAVKGEMETIKAWFEKQATDDLRDTKSKTVEYWGCLLYTSPSPRDRTRSRMPSSA